MGKQSFQVLRHVTLQVQVDLDPANALPVVYRRPMQFGHIWTMNQHVVFFLGTSKMKTSWSVDVHPL